jgi:hypothetical protein
MKTLKTTPKWALTAAALTLLVALGEVRADGGENFSSGNNVGSMPTLSSGDDLGAARTIQGWYVSGERNAVLACVIDAFTGGDGVSLILADTEDQDIRIEFRGPSTVQISEAALLEGGIELGLIAGELTPMKFALELDGAMGPVGTLGADTPIEVPYERLHDAGVLDAPFALHTLQLRGDRARLSFSAANGLLTIVQQ